MMPFAACPPEGGATVLHSLSAMNGVEENGGAIASCVTVNTNTSNIINNNNNGEPALRKGPWMPEEDEILVEYVRQYGPRDWSSIRSKGLLPRTGKSCRLRWVNKLKPDLKSGCKFSPEEEKLVVEMQAKLGNKWAKIASHLPGRTDNDVKNFWSTRQKRIMRALQRPKPQSDVLDFPKVGCLSDFSPYEVEAAVPLQSVPSGGATDPLQPFPDVGAIDPSVQAARLDRHHAFSSDMDDILMVKLQDLIAGDSLLMDTDLTDMQPLSMVSPDDASQCSATSSTTINNTAQNPQNPKINRKRPPKHHPLDHLPRKIRATANFERAASQVPHILPGIPADNLEESDGNQDLGVDLYIDPNDSNILDFLLQPEDAESEPKNPAHSFSTSELALLPSFPPDGIEVIKGEQESCTPDSVLGGFPTDVFDSLEPLSLSPTAADWWDSRNV